MNDPIEFCTTWVGPMTPAQRACATEHIEAHTLLGVGRPVGSMEFGPMVLPVGKTIPLVIDKLGGLQPAALEGRRLFLRMVF